MSSPHPEIISPPPGAPARPRSTLTLLESLLWIAALVLTAVWALQYLTPDISILSEWLEQVQGLFEAEGSWQDALLPTFLVLLVSQLIRLFAPNTPRSRALVSLLFLFVAYRYLFWRIFGTLTFETLPSACLCLLLLFTELSRYVESTLALVQMLIVPFRYRDRSAEADRHAPAVLCGDFQPSVDVLVPTCGEPVEMLRRTIIGCQAMAYANKRVYLLDDSDRAAVRKLAEELGCGYFARGSALHAKAGNLNHALANTHGELICCFDCDFVPTRDFLVRTVGFFLDPKVAMVQTPKHFMNVESIRFNLGVQQHVTCEEDEFYRFILPLRDATNSFICHGSGHIERRAVLEEIGGFPTECKIEDLYTSMKMQAKGYQTVYLNEELSAGDASDSIHAFVDQRMRWAHGCLQALFVPSVNPLRLAGLSLMQRVHYTATIFYWLVIPGRLVFLLAPLCYLFIGWKPIATSVEAILRYWLPCVFLYIGLYSWINGGKRTRYWSEVYDTLLCVPIGLVILQVLWNPFGPRSRVTPKARTGGLLINWAFSTPLLVIAALSILALAWPFLTGSYALTNPEANLINICWTGYNLAILSVAVQACIDAPQDRFFLRFRHRLPATLRARGLSAAAQTVEVSESGALLEFTMPPQFLSAMDRVELDIAALGLSAVPVTLFRRDRTENLCGVEFPELTLPQRRCLTEYLFCQPGQWTEHSVTELLSLWAFLTSVLRLHSLSETRDSVPPPRE